METGNKNSVELIEDDKRLQGKAWAFPKFYTRERVERRNKMRETFTEGLSNTEKRRCVNREYERLTCEMRSRVLGTAKERQCSPTEAELFLRYCDKQYGELYRKGLALSSFLIYGQPSQDVNKVLANQGVC